MRGDVVRKSVQIEIGESQVTALLRSLDEGCCGDGQDAETRLGGLHFTDIEHNGQSDPVVGGTRSSLGEQSLGRPRWEAEV